MVSVDVKHRVYLIDKCGQPLTLSWGLTSISTSACSIFVCQNSRYDCQRLGCYKAQRVCVRQRIALYKSYFFIFIFFLSFLIVRITCAQMLMHAIAQRGPYDCVHWKFTLGENSLAASGTRARVRRALYQLSYCRLSYDALSLATPDARLTITTIIMGT